MPQDEMQTCGVGRGPLRFITCGSVDDGKSTLLGRLLFEARLVSNDQLAAAERDSLKHGPLGGELDMALLLDGLEAEREQGITIDVAYRYFRTPCRSFIAADTPDHAQFTRNMATAASTADAAIVLVDARKGLVSQTWRHSYICSVLGVRTIILAVNKMDLVDFDSEVFRRIRDAFTEFVLPLGYSSVLAIPTCARDGDNIMTRSHRTTWHAGPTLIEALEVAEDEFEDLSKPFRFPVQWVNRPTGDFRGYSGTIAGGLVRVRDMVVSPRSGQVTRVARIATFNGDLASAKVGQAVTLLLDDEIDLARGDLLCSPDRRPEFVDQLNACLVWMNANPLLPGRSYWMRVGTAVVPARVSLLKYKLDVNTREHLAARTLEFNEIGNCNIAMSSPCAIDAYSENRRTGAFILIDRDTNETVAAGMIRFALRRAKNIHRHHHAIGKPDRASLLGQKPCVIWFTGLSGSGKSTIADLVERDLHDRGYKSMLLDGDNIRHGLNSDLGFSDADRVENIRRVGEVAKLMLDAGLIVLCCFISPFAQERQMVRALFGEGEFIEVFVDTPLSECEKRDPKGLYSKARAGEIGNFTGIGSRYEPPVSPTLRIDGAREDAANAAKKIVSFVLLRQASG
jgi:bifunctional enzyme CysN/CysC